MKKIFFLMSLSLILWGCGGNESPSEMVIGEFTTIEVQHVYDEGDVAKGALIKEEIKIKNTGDYPLVIAAVQPSCSCTVSEFSKEPIAPGETTIISAEVNTDKTGVGRISKPINITANTRPSTTTITIKANVID